MALTWSIEHTRALDEGATEDEALWSGEDPPDEMPTI